MRLLVSKIINYMRAEASKPCRTDKEGSSYISANNVVRGFTAITIGLSILIFSLMPYYAQESPETAVVLFVIAVIDLCASLRILMTRYTLTGKGIVCKAFTERLLTYDGIIEAAGDDPPYINNQYNAVFYAGNRRKVKIALEFFYGSASLIRQLEKETGLKFEEKEAAEKPNPIPLLLLLALGIVLFYLKNKK